MIPMIRAGAIFPIISWLQDNGRPFEDRLREVDLSYVLENGPDLPIPLGPALTFLSASSRLEGPDLPFRVMGQCGVQNLGMIGKAALASRTIGEALSRVAALLPYHVTHQAISIIPAAGGLLLRRASGLRLDDEARHCMHQYFAAQIYSLCTIASAPPPVFDHLALTPHPIYGISHLRPWFGETVKASTDKSLELFVSARLVNTALPHHATEGAGSELYPTGPTLMGDGTLTHSARIVIAGMLTAGTPTIERLATASGIGVRTIQRRLHAEGNTFSDLLESLRLDLATAGLAESGISVGEIAMRLGYRQQSSFTRAVRRWTGIPPTAVSRRART